ncbi:MAG TPA: hypothetical protein VNJ01_14005 [Bacteriovoracaceae bacterium]|nr:hypothetical protein [Bacteriovoracaceae bacterium]
MNANLDFVLSDGAVSQCTKEVLLSKERKAGSALKFFSSKEVETLESAIGIFLPGKNSTSYIISELDEELAHGLGKGWRVGCFPEDKTLYQHGLKELSEKFMLVKSRPERESLIQEHLGQQTLFAGFLGELLVKAVEIHYSLPASLLEISCAPYADKDSGP